MNLRRWAAVAALMALPVAVMVWAQTVQQDGSRTDPGRRGSGQGMLIGGINSSDTTFVIPRFNSSGSLQVAEASPAYDTAVGPFTLLDNVTLALGAADSNGTPVDTRRMRLGMLFIKANIQGTGTVDTTTVAQLAIQIRSHLNAGTDSASVFPIYHYGAVPVNVATAVAADTSSQGHLYSAVPFGDALATPQANTAWSGEYVVKINAKRNAHASSVAVNGHTFYYPNGIAIPLSSLFGRDIYSPYTSVRVRVLWVAKGAAVLTGGQVKVSAHLVGTPL